MTRRDPVNALLYTARPSEAHSTRRPPKLENH